MALEGDKVKKGLKEITECPICMSEFTDPRILPCIHTFCIQCLNHTAEAELKKSGDEMSCPVCRKAFIIPQEGIVGLQKNFFMENLLKITSLLESETNLNYCTEHIHKPLDYYCADCKKVVCVSCFVENHKMHNCKDVSTVDAELRQRIEKKAWKISTLAHELKSIRKNSEKTKATFLNEILQCENAIKQGNQELKYLIDSNTESLLDKLSAIKSNHMKEIEGELETIDKRCAELENFETFCRDLILERSASDICSSVDQLFVTANTLETDHEALIDRPQKSVEVTFKTGDLWKSSQKFDSNFVGHIIETKVLFENCAIVVGINDGPNIMKDVMKINLHRPNAISTQEQIPTTIEIETAAAVYCNTMYVTGAGVKRDEIWKYNMTSGWMRCASLVKGRRRHSVAFIDEVLYICGGFVDSDTSALDSVEAYNADTGKCALVGQLRHCVQASGNCVPYKRSLFIFGGMDKDKRALNHVQVYDTKENTCTLNPKPLPCPYSRMRAVRWQESVILLGCHNCFIFNFETETWRQMKQFKTNANHFGLVLENERVFVIGGGTLEKNEHGIMTWKCRNDVRYIPLQSILQEKPIEWKIHGTLPKPSLIHACEKLTFIVPQEQQLL